MHGHEAWLAKARSDLKSSKKLARDDDETLDTAAYHTQQCAEKALKAYNDSLDLSIYAMYARYPDDRFCIDRQELEESIKKAAKIYRFIIKKIDAPINPTLNLFED